MKKISFPDYWSIAKKLTQKERDYFFSSFSRIQQKQIKRSYQLGGWKDVFLRNKVDELCDLVKSVYDIDLYDIRIRILMKKERILIHRVTWDDITDAFSEYDLCFDLTYVFGRVHSKVHALDPHYYELYSKLQK